MSVFVSGSTGYIAQHIISQLLEQGYKVIGTARSQEKADHLLKDFNNSNLSIEIVPDISDLNAFDEPIKKHAKEIKYVIHAASPLPHSTNDLEKDILTPAVNGTKGILDSIKKYAPDQVERVVITSSYAAIGNFALHKDNKFTFNEESWNPITWEEATVDPHTAYLGSKKFAEKAAWDFYNENKNNMKFKLTTVNPTFVFGPQVFDSAIKPQLGGTSEMINQLIHSSKDDEKAVSEFYAPYIDVRDVAKAHILAFQKDNSIEQRLMLFSEKCNQQDVLDILNQDFPVLCGKIAKGTPNTGVLNSDFGAKLDNSKTRELLGFKFKELKETIDDCATQILKHEGKL